MVMILYMFIPTYLWWSSYGIWRWRFECHVMDTQELEFKMFILNIRHNFANIGTFISSSTKSNARNTYLFKMVNSSAR